jgi:uncharacterized protein with PIN domain
MSIAYFRFYEELNDFLPHGKKKKLFSYEFSGTPSVKDAIEAIGVPHVEVDLILVNSLSVEFSYKLNDQDTISVYPVFESFDISSVTHLREKPLRNLKFISDVHLGKLTRYLRLCGIDTYCQTDLNDAEIIDLAISDQRIILTRDKGLLKNKKVTHGYWIRSQYPRNQLKEIFLRFDLVNNIAVFTRCMECNGVLRDVSKKEILDRLLPRTRQYYRKFKICDGCNRIYWNGSHYQNMKRDIKTLLLKTSKSPEIKNHQKQD